MRWPGGRAALAFLACLAGFHEVERSGAFREASPRAPGQCRRFRLLRRRGGGSVSSAPRHQTVWTGGFPFGWLLQSTNAFWVNPPCGSGCPIPKDPAEVELEI
jgi:hypothetical protein